jgi:molybdenum cofactor sulfurtransferase
VIARFIHVSQKIYSSRLSLRFADEARTTVLSFFHAPPEYTVIFTANASSALKLVGEAFPFGAESSYVLGADSHNSVHGIREFAQKRDCGVHYIPSTPHGGFDEAKAKVNFPLSGKLHRN